MLADSGDARHFVLEAYKHLKAIGAIGDGKTLLDAVQLTAGEEGIAVGSDAAAVMTSFVEAMSKHRVWSRAQKAEAVPA
jgi:catalase